MTDNNNQPSTIVRFFRVLLRVILALLFGILLGAGIYFGFQFAYQQLVIPIRENAQEIQNLNTRVNQQWELLQENNADLEDRLTQLETDLDDSDNKIAELIAKQTQLSADLDAYQLQQTELGDQITEINKGVSDLFDQVDELSSQNEKLQSSLNDLDLRDKLQPIYQDLQLFKVLLQVNRSRLYLVQDNYGLAKQELEIADGLLNVLRNSASEDQKAEILLWDARLKLAISHLPNNPILANDDLEILWTMMVDGFTNEIDTQMSEDSATTVEPSQSPTATPTPKP